MHASYMSVIKSIYHFIFALSLSEQSIGHVPRLEFPYQDQVDTNADIFTGIYWSNLFGNIYLYSQGFLMPISRKLNNVLLVTFVLLLEQFKWQKCEIFTSVAHLENLIDVNLGLTKVLEEHVSTTEQNLKELREILEDRPDDFAQIGRPPKTASFNVTIHPSKIIQAFARVRRKLRRSLGCLGVVSKLKEDLKTYLKTIQKSVPTAEDVDGASNAILRLQETYKLDAKSFIRLASLHSMVLLPMTLDEVYKIGRTAYSRSKMQLTKDWMRLALDMLESGVVGYIDEKENGGVNYQIDIRDHLAYANFRLEDYSSSLNYTEQILRIDPHNENALENLEILKDKLKTPKHKTESKNQDKEEEYYMQHKYESLCRGETVKGKRKEKSKDVRYVCGYSNKHPILVLKPIKYEILSVSPLIYAYYGMASKLEMRVLKRLAFPFLERAVVSDTGSNEVQPASYRISKSCWIPDHHHNAVRSISRRMEAVTGLTTETAEELQIANYGIGGHYEPHYDWSRNFETSEMRKFGQGNRIATALLYLNDVTRGGATVFIEPGLTIYPAQGMMVFWHNLYKNGKGKYNTMHAACPVLLGNKWVANKWFHERGQEFRRRCSLDRFE